ncbi:MAG: NAD(P)H-dependent oxidoreductase subunit E [Mariniphaga sp.]
MLGKRINHSLHQKQNIEVCFSEPTLDKVLKIISRYPEGKQKSAIIPVLHIAQEEFGGYLNVDTMDYVAGLLGLEPIEVYEVATFYSQYYLDPVGKYVIETCRTGPCAICGGEAIQSYLEKKLGIKTGESTTDGLFTLKTVECLGACGYAPVMQINTEFYEFLTPAKIDKIIETLTKKSEEEKAENSKWTEKFF